MTRLAILGATGAVGATLLRVLEERDFPLDELRLLASERSAGEQRPLRAARTLEVQAVGPSSFDGIDIAIFSAGATRSRKFAPQAVAAGAVVVDNSSAFRMDAGVPLVVPEVNPHAAPRARGRDREPELLDDAARARAVGRCTPLAARARDGLDLPVGLRHRPEGDRRRCARVGGRRSRARSRRAEVYAHPIAFNVLPFAGALQGDDGYTDEELKLVNESRKILDLPDLRVRRPACASPS